MPAGKKVKVNMKDGLTGVLSVVDHHPVSFFFKTLPGSNGLGDEKKMTDQFPVGDHNTVNVRYVLLRHNERMDRRLRIDILESDGELILVHKFCGDLSVDDLAEEAVRIECHAYLRGLFRKTSKETGAVAGMTGRTGLLYLDQQCVLVAVVQDLFDALDIARRLALLPKFLAGPAPEPGKARFNGLSDRRGVHVRDHQHLAAFPILNDRGDQSFFVELQSIRDLHTWIF